MKDTKLACTGVRLTAAKLEKIKALADRGIAGEKEAAKRILHRYSSDIKAHR